MKRKLILLTLSVLLFSGLNIKGQDTLWVKNNTWYFDNFSDPELPWSLFRETFTGVAPTPSGDFDLLFYNELYKTNLAAKGHCYGMCVLALLMKKYGGYLGYCYPPYKYSGLISHPDVDTIGPSDPNLKTAIAMVHGNQINHGFLLYLLDVIAAAKNRDGRYAFQQTVYYLAKDDPPVISVTKGLNPADGGHVLIPYFTKEIGTYKRIYVYDPNRSYYKPGADGKDWYQTYQNYIEVKNSNGEWKFIMNGGEVWTGNPGSGGNCIVIPLSVAGRKDRLPQSLIAEGAYALNTIFIFGKNKLQPYQAQWRLW
ncbi:MAG: hypothetical protein BWY67_00283 [Bacteroidetes bacterium ADurb.Bin397]|nr:MAG: hypothetical protein BWY67_00283 [Bacteroidetes bacterium ADurb.Bin397]